MDLQVATWVILDQYEFSFYRGIFRFLYRNHINVRIKLCYGCL